jgi:cysteine desulfurase
MAKRAKKIVYLDNSRATLMPKSVLASYVRWANRGDTGGEHQSARDSRRMVQKFKERVAYEGAFSLEGPEGYTVIVTSGAAESNAHMLTVTARAYATRTGKLPHIITSTIDDDTVTETARQLVRDGLAQLTIIPANVAGKGLQSNTGAIDPDTLRTAIRPNTCLISITSACRETGAIINVKGLSRVAHQRQIPYHTDATHIYGKSALKFSGLGVDAFTASFHPIGGPPGVGLLAIQNNVVRGYGLAPFIPGENSVHRGGIVNVPGIAGAFSALKIAFEERGKKNAKVRALKDEIQAALSKHHLTVHIDDYCEARPRVSDGNPMTPASSRVLGAPTTKKGKNLAERLDAAAEEDKPVVVWIGPLDRAKILPNTLLLSVLRSPPDDRTFSATKTRAALEAAGFIVGTGSRRILEALDVPPELWVGCLLVSLGDDTSREDVLRFSRHFVTLISSGKVLA